MKNVRARPVQAIPESSTIRHHMTSSSRPVSRPRPRMSARSPAVASISQTRM